MCKDNSSSVTTVSDAKLRSLLQSRFGFEEFRGQQLPAIQAVLRGEDVLLLMPTGGGKSLAYQLPALLADRGPVLVVSPLVALMNDQVQQLNAKGVKAAALNAGVTDPLTS